MSEGLVRFNEAMELAQISRRQLEHWITRGYIEARSYGFGRQRDLDPGELRVLHRMAQLVRAGFHWDRAAELARELVLLDHNEQLDLGGGIRLAMNPPPQGVAA